VLHRDSDVLDWLTDTIACAVVVVPVRYWIRRSR